MMGSKYKVVVIGGGTGTFTVLRGLKHYSELDLTAVITMTDTGGSTGRLRDEYGTLPVGDVRQCLVALSKENDASLILRELFLYRFDGDKSDLSGHNFGNLFLTALTNILGSEVKAIEAASEILNVTGRILPVTTDKVELVAKYSDGSMLHSEKNIDTPPDSHDSTARVVKFWTEPKAEIYSETRIALEEADFIVIGPGDLYSSLLSNVIIGGVPEAIARSKAKLIFIGNLVSKFGQTHGLTYKDYLAEIEKYGGKLPDFALINSTPLPDDILERYRAENSSPVGDDLADSTANVIRADLISSEVITTGNSDAIKRSYLRHDSHKLATELVKIFNLKYV